MGEPTSQTKASDAQTEQQSGWSVLQAFHRGWTCFDKWAGWLIGLDNSKYQWAVNEYKLQKQEEERIIQGRLRAEDDVRQHMEEGAAPTAGQSAPPSVLQLELTHPTSASITR